MDRFQMNEQERAILAGVSCRVFSDAENASYDTLDELEELLKTAGGVCVAKVLQSRPSPDPGTMLGEGKLAEIRELAQQQEATLLIVDNELSPSQFRAIEDATDLHVMDRSGLILDIFATRARTSEGKLQVELAQYQYLLPRLTGLGRSLSRLGGGIGTRGPGESKLETDRRHIRRRITALQRDLEEVRRVREGQRRRRIRLEIPVVAIVGYTNAGKSTLLNRLTDAGIPANNRLFDTLDPTVRKVQVTDTLDVMLSDTVGFIHKLPHNLIEAFKATLEELQYADVLLHVIDISNPHWQEQAGVVTDLIRSMGLTDRPVIEVFNKVDRIGADILPTGRGTAVISAKTGMGIDILMQEIAAVLDTGRKRVRIELPYRESARLDILYKDAKVEQVEYTNDCIQITAVCEPRTLGWIGPYIVMDRGEEE